MEFGAVSYIHAGLQLGYFIHKGHSATRLSGMKQGFEAELRLDGVSLEQTINTDRRPMSKSLYQYQDCAVNA